MKNLLVGILLLAAIGCTDPTTAKTQKTEKEASYPEPQFTYKQEVLVQRGFLKGHTLRIDGYTRCKDLDGSTDGTVCYNGRIDDESDWSDIPESNLVP